MKGFYIAIDVHGRGIRRIDHFNSKEEFLDFADRALLYDSIRINKSDTIYQICEKLYDSYPGLSGARSCYRISFAEAKKITKERNLEIY